MPTREFRALCGLLALAALCAAGPARAQGGSYVNFETIPNRALALSPDGQRLFVTNTPAGRLEIFQVTASGLRPRPGVQVGLDPIAVAARSDTEVWVVNHLSDSVSVIDLTGPLPRVVRTLLVGDEPRDIVFAGPGRSRAFISAARRGQNHPGKIEAELRTPGLPRADVWVFDANRPGASLGGSPLAVVPLFGDKPGGLAASPDGKTVYAGIFSSGNETTVISQESICGPRQDDGPCERAGGTLPGGVPGPNTDQVNGDAGPLIGTIVRFDRRTQGWLDVLGRDWRNAVRFRLPDRDVFRIDATANPPAPTGSFQHVGTLNAGMAVHPTSGSVYVATIEAINQNRFLSLPGLDLFPNPAGPVKTADPLSGRTLNGHLYESRISVLGADGSVRPRHLNKHIDYEVVPSPPGVKERSVSQPHSVSFSADGETLYVAALGSNQIVRFRTRQIDDDSFVPDASAHIALSGSGPTNLVIDAANRRGYVYTRFDDAVATLDLDANRELEKISLADPEPPAITRGRRFFYDATLGSSNGEASCAVCHPAADKDDLAWDLGTPFLGRTPDPNPVEIEVRDPTFSPLKGPMTVLTLRGIRDSGPMFWRGDRTNPENFRDARRNFKALDVVFPGLLGRDGFLPPEQFDALTDWALSIVPPPNPVRRLDGALSASQQAGSELFFGRVSDGQRSCAGCHATDPGQGFFGTDGETVDDNQAQNFKIPQLRNQYDKVGMFGRTDDIAGVAALGDQVRGTGTRHNGSNAGTVEFLTRPAFEVTAAEREQLADFMNAFPSNLAPVVGQQVTVRADSGADVRARVQLLIERASTPFVLPAPDPGSRPPEARECDLIAKGVIGGAARGFLLLPDGRFQDDAGGPPRPAAALLALAAEPGQELTFTCVYPGGGRRLGIDRDEDGTPDFAQRESQGTALPGASAARR